MKIYLDSCAVQRPLDSAIQARIALEIEAILGVYRYIESGSIELISSEVLEYEISRITTPIRKLHAISSLKKATHVVEITVPVEHRARLFVAQGFKSYDALHLACAEAGEADYFCTCDDRLLKRARLLSNIGLV